MISNIKRMMKIEVTKIPTYKDRGEDLRSLFGDKSHAVTQEGHFVPIIPRHMTKENWRDLFWLQPVEVVIHGRRYKSLCSLCALALDCVRKESAYDFECRASSQTLDLKRS